MNAYTLELLAHDREHNASDHAPDFPSDDELDEIEYDNERLRIEAMLKQERDDNREMNAARSW